MKPARGASRKVATAPGLGVKSPGVLIPFASLKAELTYPVPADANWVAVTDSVWLSDLRNESLLRIDPVAKQVKSQDPIGGLAKPCGGAISAFNSLWIPTCGDGGLARIDIARPNGGRGGKGGGRLGGRAGNPPAEGGEAKPEGASGSVRAPV
jgi:streptogramin lyase